MFAWYWITIVGALGFPFLVRFVRKWIVVPIKIHRTQTMAVGPDLQHATAEHITPELSQLLQSVLPQFRAEGFESAAMTCNVGNVPGVRSVQATLVHRATGDVAVIMGAWGKSTRSLVYGIRSEFVDGTNVITGVNRAVGAFPPDPCDLAVSFSKLPDIHALCEFHRRRLRHLGVEERPRHRMPPGSAIERFEREWERTTSRLVRLGYMYPDHSAKVFRYTWKGAFLCTWRITPPIKTYRIRRRDRKAHALWRELQMPGDPADAPAPAHPAQPPPPPTAVTTQTAAGASDLTYEIALPDGEIRLESTAAGLTVRVGTPTGFQFLARSWSFLLWMLICGAGLSWFLFRFVLLQRFATRLGLPIMPLVWPLIGLALFLFLGVLRLLNGLLLLRGTIVLNAWPQGLTFRNTPTGNRSGHIARDDLQGFLVVPIKKRARRRSRYALFAMREDDRPQLLFLGRDADQVEDVRAGLAQAIGIECRE